MRFLILWFEDPPNSSTTTHPWTKAVRCSKDKVVDFSPLVTTSSSMFSETSCVNFL